MQYKDYLIETLETSPGRWRARVRRADGQKIRIVINNSVVDTILTSGMESFSPNHAVRVAKEMIDGGGMR